MTFRLRRPAGGVARAAAAQARACAGRGDAGQAAVAAEAAAGAEGEPRTGPAAGAALPFRSMRKMLLAALSRLLQGPAAAGRTVSAAAERGRCRPGRQWCGVGGARGAQLQEQPRRGGGSCSGTWLRRQGRKTYEKLKKKTPKPKTLVFPSPTLRDDPK